MEKENYLLRIKDYIPFSIGLAKYSNRNIKFNSKEEERKIKNRKAYLTICNIISSGYISMGIGHYATKTLEKLF